MREVPPPRDIVVAPRAALAEALAARVEQQAARALAAKGSFSVALAGGSIAPAFFPRLARLRLDWARVAFFWADERSVPPGHPDSNYRLAHELWLAPAGVPPASIHRMPAERTDLEAAAVDHERELRTALGDPPRLDVAILGVGEDGHVASLFPGHPALREERSLVVAVTDAPKPPPRRLTMTLPMVAGAGLVIVGALGESKSVAVAAVLDDPASELSIALLARRAHRTLLLLDPAAARGR